MNCNTCKKRLDLRMSDYSSFGCKDYDLGGYICMAFANEGKAIWMIGQNEYTGYCECYQERKNERSD